jgi:peptidoglycan/LPS O-acetylase OafA/YrhL
MTAPERSLQFRPDIEGLRAVAVLLVVACHCGIPWSRGGFIGVDVFFVLSGYLISGLLMAEIRGTSRLDLPLFYARRARRLLPALLLVLVVTLVAGVLIQGPQELQFAGRAARATALYVSNVFFDRDAADYFAPDVESSPFLHTWSLGVEEQFYLVWPLLLLLGTRRRRSHRPLVALLAGVASLSLLFCIWATAYRPTLAFYELPARAWEFALGGLLACAGDSRLRGAAASLLGWLGLVAVLATAYLLRDGAGFPGWFATVPALGTVAVLSAGPARSPMGVGLLLNSRPMQYLGARSYSWYLWHWPFIVLAAAIVPAIPIIGKVIVGAASLGAASLTYQLVEQPVRHDSRLVRRTLLSLLLAAGTAVGAATIAFLVVRRGEHLAHEPPMLAITTASTDIADLPRERCVSLGQSTEVRSCIFADTASLTEVVLYGDSHALQWFNAIEPLARESHWRLVTVLKSGCPAVEIEAAIATSSEVCSAWRAAAQEFIIARHPALVVAASFTSRFGEARPSGIDPELTLLTTATREMLARFTGAGLRVVLLRDTPLPPFDVPTCLARRMLHPWLGTGSCTFERKVALDPRVFEAERRAAFDLPRVQLLDMTDELCPASTCPAMHDNIMVYRDHTHISGTFARSLAPAIGARLRTAPASFSSRRPATLLVERAAPD